MSIAAAFNSSLSGLNATSRRVQLTASNVAGAMTEGYGRRELSVSVNAYSGGVRIDGVMRQVDPGTLRDMRLGTAASGNAGTRADALARIETAIGDPTADGSIPARLAAFEGALIEAGSRPDSTIRLDAAVRAGDRLASALNTATDEVQETRRAADAEIASQVGQLNDGLKQVHELNAQIFRLSNSGRDVSGLMDQRQTAIDELSGIVPLREVPREGGQVALFTTGGTILLDGRMAKIEFAPAGYVTADLTQASGALSPLIVDDIPVSMDPGGQLDGGTLAALFDTRDRIAPGAQAGLDALARDLAERLQGTAVDPTLGPGDPGLFTDAGAAIIPANEVGLAGRLRVNAAIDPDAGGESWRLRDGLAAPLPGDTGSPSLLHAISDAFGGTRAPSSGPAAGLARTASGHAADIVSAVSVLRQGAVEEQSYQAARASTLTEQHLAGGVDTDREMQNLLSIEQAYAANARVIQTLDTLMQQLMEI
ncbi:flagellar hook-associated protein FlgK [Tropicimonas sp. IMCC34011]|uniref:flagellar hook-associated protein FlgK n=1 Tax=Tropicimonas sp. IMCC34011 TaxID=2248759 RepID=UPI000E26A252|nr:flagellar hook-associated protein FlgK [Tropicimonas sp. IMCC34011]